MEIAKERKTNYELLRIILIIGVIILHYINAGMGGGLKYVQENSANYYVLMFLVSINACAVNLFVLLSGYFLCESNTRDIQKPIDLIIRVMVFSFLIYCMRCIMGSGFTVKGAIASLVPANYFVILYIVVYLLSPFINICINNINHNKLIIMLVICMVLFSIWPTSVDVFDKITGTVHDGLSTIGAYGSQRGYTIVQFVLMYIIGAFLNRIHWKKIHNGIKWGVLFGNGLLITVWSLVDNSTAWEYCNPLIIVQAVVVFLIFRDINIKHNKFINSLSKSVFTTFLVHTVFLGKIGINKAVQLNVPLMIVHILVSSIVIFIVCWIVNMIYTYTIGWFTKKISLKWTV